MSDPETPLDLDHEVSQGLWRTSEKVRLLHLALDGLIHRFTESDTGEEDIYPLGDLAHEIEQEILDWREKLDDRGGAKGTAPDQEEPPS